MKITEQNFIKQISLGNEKALEYCMLHYGGLVRSVVHRHIGSLAHYEEDCINEVFFAVWENIDSYRPDRNPFANWIAGVARLKALDCLRKHARQLLESSWEENLPSQASQEDTALQAIEEEISRETQQMLDCLKPQDRELFIRLYIEEQDIEEISQSTGMSKPAIYNHLSRGKRKLRKLFPRHVQNHREETDL